ncbi:glycosyl transferase [Nitrosomonas sp. Nm132]|uniref:glycosyl transferase n=1 Tax=Nitrosomonas sp. Nm132 TaxID=1881053 RepID=UPI0008855D77|nr:glycosyl transferase [Nitrosomonas sp. Nm132]SDH87456.1 Glycosyltransferase involved in cell wall bisynthesis [Nitrosomonas sp. Nm132]
MQLVYLSPLPWNSFVQRPHKFVEWFHHKYGGNVLWVDPYPTRLPKWTDLRRIKTTRIFANPQTVKAEIPNWLTVIRPHLLPIEPLPGASFISRWLLWRDILRIIDQFMQHGGTLLGIGKPSELALQVLAQYPAISSFYDAMDDFPAFYQGLSRAAMARREQRIADSVSRISVSSTTLAERFSAYHSKLTVVHNACTVETLPPIDAIKKQSEDMVIGYLGTIGHWFDWPFVLALAQANSSLNIHLIGPVYTSVPEPLPCNIRLFPACDHVTAIGLMQAFSVGLIPFKCSDLTASIDPIKYYEYRALGLPILSTYFGEMARRQGQAGIFIVDANSDLTYQVNAAMVYKYRRNEIQIFRKNNSWEARFNASDFLPCSD